MSRKIIATITGIALFSTMLTAGAFATTGNDISKSINSNMENSQVRVFVEDGTAYLRGTVSYVDDIAQAADIAKSSSGVERVVNQLSVYTPN